MEADQEEAAIKVEEITIKVENPFESEEFSLSHIKFEFKPERGTSLVIKEENELILDESIYDETSHLTESVDPLEIPEVNTNIENCKEVHRSQRVLSCTRCSDKFTNKKILMRHIIAVHVDEEHMETSTVSAFSSLLLQQPKKLCKIGRTGTVIKVEGELIEDVNDFISESSLHSATDFVKTRKTCKRNNKPFLHRQREQRAAGAQGNKVNLDTISKDINDSSSLVNSDGLPKQSKTYYNSDCIKLKVVSVLLENIGPRVLDKLKIRNKSPVDDKQSLNCDPLYSSEPQNQLEENVDSRELSDGSNGKEKWFSCAVCPSKYKLKSSFQRHLARHCRAGLYPFAEYLANVGPNIDPQISISFLESQQGTSCKTDISTEISDLYKPEKSEPTRNMKNFQMKRSSCRVLSCAHCAEKFTDKTVLMKHLITYCGENSFCDDVSSNSNSNKTSVYSGDSSLCHDVSSKSKLKNLSLSPLNTNENSSCDNAVSKSEPNNLVKNPLNSDENVLLRSEYSSDIPQIKLFTCPICHKYFRRKCGLKNHFILHPDEKNFPCPHCSYNFVTLDVFLSHLTEKHATYFSCSYCSKKFKQIQLLKSHEVIHTGIKPFVCTECPARFKRKGDLNVHLRKHFSEAEFKCTLCPFQFYRRNDFNKHIRSHSNKRIYVCLHCSKRYKEKYHLKCHMSRHIIEKRFSCSECSLKFKLKQDLRRHLFNVHSDSRLFGCSLCSKKFNNSNVLKAHLVTHSAKRLSCAHCTSSFRYKPDLIKHLQRMHSTSKQSTCSFCSKTFNGAFKLKRHLQKLHADNLNVLLKDP